MRACGGCARASTPIEPVRLASPAPAFLLLALVGPACSGAAVVSEQGAAAAVPPRLERTLQEDLHRLFRAQERHRSTIGTYSDDLIELRFVPSPGVRVRLPEADSTGFSAVARRSPYECALYVGDADPPRRYLEAPSVVGCAP